ncbi:MAG TPA: ribosome-associated translation inhibitor RaiA, partial [Candidatus Saccharimonadales bacterium]|nr:ribosome-associated translation inhibitor RaiA [Candidatus Saccharimonadales bacterium]
MSRTAESRTMKLEITGRHVKVTPALKTMAKEKLAKIRKLLDGPLECHVVLTVEKHRHAAEIVVRGRSVTLSAREVTDDMYTSIGECAEKLETQARKRKEKYATRRRRPVPVGDGAPEPA